MPVMVIIIMTGTVTLELHGKGDYQATPISA